MNRWLATLGICWAALSARALEIADVSHVPPAFDPRNGEQLSVRFRLTERSRATLRIYDGRELLIREVNAEGLLEAGEHLLSWDGKDGKGRPVPPEAYVYTLWANGQAGQTVEYDLTDLTGNNALPLVYGAWDPATHEIRYELPTPARVNIRAGLDQNGPLLRTVIDWVARGRGPQAERWDGMDASGVLDASRHPDLQLTVAAWSLPDNAVLVLPRADEVQLIRDVNGSAVRRTRKRESRRDPRALDQIPIEDRRDPKVKLVLAGNLPRDPDGIPIVGSPLAIQIDTDDRDRMRIVNQQMGVGFFVDGKFVFENEVGFLPTTWRWDPKGVNPGIHFLTGNIWGFSGQFGSATVRVRVKHEGPGQ